MESTSTQKNEVGKVDKVERGSSSKVAEKVEEALKVSERSKPSERIKEALKLREMIKSKKPEFVRQESWRYKRIKESWRRPKGIDNKMRKKVKGWPKIVRIGYRGPVEARGLHPSGLRDVLVHNPKELENLNPETDGARIASSVGLKKRIQIIQRAKELGIRVFNPHIEKVE
ncbi:MAG: 50S ribosomal protein L32e [Nitrososphaerales archaeon]|nr:50S ribosomal protein L32e [Nitrososphaerales archaeon]